MDRSYLVLLVKGVVDFLRSVASSRGSLISMLCFGAAYQDFSH